MEGTVAGEAVGVTAQTQLLPWDPEVPGQALAVGAREVPVGSGVAEGAVVGEQTAGLAGVVAGETD